MAKELFTEKEIEAYNKIAVFINGEKIAMVSDTTLDEGFEDDDLTNRIPCIRIVAGRTEKYNCKTGETIP